MPTFLHILKGDSAAIAAPVIEAACRQPGAKVTVVLLEGAATPTLPPGARIRRLADGDLDYPALLDLIFANDHVVSW
jgi:hypothetical protein